MVSDRRLLDIFLRAAALDGQSGRERPVADFVRAFLEPLGFRVVEDDAGKAGGGNCGNLLAVRGDGGDLMILAHMDTARPTRDVKPRLLDDRVVSDGTTQLGADCRLGVAALLRAAERLAASGSAAGATFAFTVCEETSMAGSQNLRWPANVEMAALLDSSLRPGAYIDRGYGCRRFDVALRGRAAHSGVAPEKGINALAAAAEAVAASKLGRLDEETTANIGMFAAGAAINVVPDRAELVGEVRSIRPERVDEVVADFRRAFEDAAGRRGARLEFSSRWDFAPYRIAADAPVRRRVLRALESLGLAPSAHTSAGGSDANSLNARGLPAIDLGTGAQNPHGDDEFVLFEDMDATVELALALIDAR